MIEYILLIPLIIAALCYPLRRRALVEAVAVAGSAVTLIASLSISYEVFTTGTLDEGLLYMDALSAYVLLLVSLVGLLACFYSISYLRRELEEAKIALEQTP